MNTHVRSSIYSRDLSYGRGSTAPVKDDKLPEIVDTEPWDGKDGEVCSPVSSILSWKISFMVFHALAFPRLQGRCRKSRGCVH